ncbi:MAG: hypothetical protein H6686_11370 [Fibrobacteria bacterium]|nr:hypothetical protein [Fibrobacteria bacterium]
MKIAMLAVALIVGLAEAGVNRTNFFYYKATYKDYLGRTRHRQYFINVFDENASYKWLGHGFLDGNPKHGMMKVMNDGKNVFHLITEYDDVRTLWVQPQNRSYASTKAFNRHLASHPNFASLNNIFGCSDGTIYAQSRSDWSVVRGSLNQESLELLSWKGKTGVNDLVGISGACNTLEKKIIVLDGNGKFIVWDDNLEERREINIEKPKGRRFLSLKGDGFVDETGRVILWAQTVESIDRKPVFGIERMEYSVASGTLQVRWFPLGLPVNANRDETTGALALWKDFIPFWTGANDVRILAVSNNRIHVFSGDGRWLESPWGNAPIDPADPWGSWKVNGPFYLARTIMTNNTRGNYSSNREFYVADDFEAGGDHGIHRFQWLDDGFSDYIEAGVEVRDDSRPGEPISRLSLTLENKSIARQLVDPKIRLWINRSEFYPDDLVCDKYYINSENASCNVGCSETNPNNCWIDLVLGDDLALDPAGKTIRGDISIGVHPKTWDTWGKQNDFSLKMIGDQWRPVDEVTLFTRAVDGGEWTKVWGKEPDPAEIPLPKGWTPGNPPVDESYSHVSNMDDVRYWKLISNGTIGVDLLEFRTGNGSLRMQGNGWIAMESIPFSAPNEVSKISFSSKSIRPIGNIWWQGQLQVFLESKSMGVYNQFVGTGNITNANFGDWVNYSMVIPSYIREKLVPNVHDLVVRLTVVSPENGGPILIDELLIE